MVATNPVVIEVLGLSAVVVALVTLWRYVGRPAHQLALRVREFLDDWNGSEPRPGRPRVKAMPERISELEETMRALTENVSSFQAESAEDRADLRARLEDLRAGRDRGHRGP